MLEGSNIIGLYSKSLMSYETLLSCSFSEREAIAMCKNFLGTEDIRYSLEFTNQCAPANRVYDPNF